MKIKQEQLIYVNYEQESFLYLNYYYFCTVNHLFNLLKKAAWR
jgi:hypothetical protein